MAIETEVETGMERRRFCRRSISEFNLLTADLLPAGTAGARQQPCIVLNLSECGLAVQPFLRLFPGSLVDLRIGIPGVTKPFATKGMVAWTAAGGPAGIQLIDLASEMREGLRKWVGDDLGLASPSIYHPEVAGMAAQEFASALHLITRRAQVVTRANGAAIALGDAESMVCRASAGVAPDLGVSLRTGFGLAGQCLFTGKLVQTSDARSDPRIDASVARQLQLGSAVIMPICTAEKLAGVLAVFSRHPRAFDNFHIRRLEQLATVLAGALETPTVEPPETESKAGSGSKPTKFDKSDTPDKPDGQSKSAGSAIAYVPDTPDKLTRFDGFARSDESAKSARSDRPGQFRPSSSLLTPMQLAAEVESRPLNRLESLWNLIESTHYRRRSSNSVQ